MSEYRAERDSMGEVHVPADAYYGAQTQRAVENFPISGWRLPPAMISAMGLVKYACGVANRDLGKLTGSGKNPLIDSQVDAMLDAASEIADGKLADQFPIDVFQTGSGTSSNMNVNEVISNRATEIAGGDRMAEAKLIHPNDHVNMGQSTNDTFPTAIHVATAIQIQQALLPALRRLHEGLAQKAKDWDKVIKIGRTHLMDATPLRLGQEFGGFARQIRTCRLHAPRRRAMLYWNCPSAELRSAAGSTRIPNSVSRVAKVLAEKSGIPFVEAVNHFEANAQRDALVAIAWRAKVRRPDVVQCRQQHSLARQRSALRVLRSEITDATAGQFDHAGQSESGDVRIDDAVDRACDGQRRLHDHQRGDGRQLSVEHHDAGHGAYDSRNRFTCWPKAPMRSSNFAWTKWKRTKSRAKRRWSKVCRCARA